MTSPIEKLLSSFSESTQSVCLESLFWTSAYLVYSSLTPSLITKLFKDYPFWARAKLRTGVVTNDAQSDFVYLLTVGFHHLIAGLLMTAGVVLAMPQLWRHGYLIETGFELADLVAMNARLYPYHNNSIKQELRYAFIFHHLPGISLSWFVFEAGLNENHHMQSIGMWLLLAASFSACVQAYIHSLDFSKDLAKAALVNMANVLFFVYGRFYMFPKDVYGILNVVAASPTLYRNPMRYMLYTGATFLTLFNIVILGELIPKMIRYNKKGWAQFRESRKVAPSIRRSSFAKELALRGSMTASFLSDHGMSIGDFANKEA